ncbi:MAG TPA: hypothetical protein VFX02_13225 [Gammaproteobacteria bacterium]|nr:hypothetical protein [Gammaproteobacteria bacterium]
MKMKLTTLIGSLALISSVAFAQTTTGSSTGNSATGSDSSSASGSSSSHPSMGSGSMGSSSTQAGQNQSSPGSSTSPQGFTSLDKDSSGEISRREAASQQSLSRVFDRADENKDGQLSQSEYEDALSQDSTSVQ